MIIRINKSLIWDQILLYSMLVYVMIGIWIGIGITQIEVVLMCLAVARVLMLLFGSRISKEKKLVCFLFIIVLTIILIFSSLISKSTQNLKDNIIYILKVSSVCMYFSCIIYQEDIKYVNIIVKLFSVLNLYWVVNTAIMFLQLNETYFLIDKGRIPSAVFYPDYIAGLFGINGTHRLTLFCIFVASLNLFVFRFKLVKYYKRIPYFLLVMSLIMAFLSTQNDNNMFFFIYPLFLFVLYSFMYKVNFRRIGKLALVVGLMVIIVIMFISYNREILKAISARLGDIISVYILHDVTVWDERSELLRLAFQSNGWILGNGIGSAKMYSDIRLSIHWGMNSIMSFIYFFGIWGFIVYILNYVCLFSGNMHKYSREIRIKYKGTLLIAIIVLANYCQIFSEMNLMILFLLIILILSETVRFKSIIEN